MQATLTGTGGRLMVFMHGWPDTSAVWCDQIKEFEKSNRCLALTLPGFSGDQLESWGYNFDDLCIMIAKQVEKHRENKDDKAVLVCHDWGAFLGFQTQCEFDDLFSCIVAFDVGPPLKSVSLRTIPALVVMGFAYQYMLVGAFLCGRLVPLVGKRIGDYFAQCVASYMHVPKDTLPHVTSEMGYPYLYFHLNFVREMFGIRAQKFQYNRSVHQGPSCPCLFFYGTEKPLMFHSGSFESALKKRPDCQVIPMKTGHWIMNHNSAEVNFKMSNFLNSKL
mmetsp:Transcript_3887/g.5653  ORF Transcript_3887/g.5653 Transcript_3887/m.5653 type:complete len:277 (-) Transcript_3887:38-868(-)